MENKQKYMKIKQTEIHENKKIYKKFPQKYYNNKTRMKDNNEVGYIDKSNHCYFRFVDQMEVEEDEGRGERRGDYEARACCLC